MTDFDPEFDKLPDQPVTIGGDKSAAAWHGPHSNLISRLRQYAAIASIYGPDGELVFEAADALERIDRSNNLTEVN
jgi:hypothetical protein